MGNTTFPHKNFEDHFWIACLSYFFDPNMCGFPYIWRFLWSQTLVVNWQNLLLYYSARVDLYSHQILLKSSALLAKIGVSWVPHNPVMAWCLETTSQYLSKMASLGQNDIRFHTKHVSCLLGLTKFSLAPGHQVSINVTSCLLKHTWWILLAFVWMERMCVMWFASSCFLSLESRMLPT